LLALHKLQQELVHKPHRLWKHTYKSAPARTETKLPAIHSQNKNLNHLLDSILYSIIDHTLQRDCR